jgi:dihydropteroate synthase type 2
MIVRYDRFSYQEGSRQSVAMTSETVRSQLVLPGIHCLARIGEPDEEAASPQVVVVALVLTFDAPPAAVYTDDLSDTVDYARLTETVATVSASQRFRLLESLAQKVHQTVLAALGPAVRLWVEVTKQRSPIPCLEPAARFGLGSRPAVSVIGAREPAHATRRDPISLRPALETDRLRLKHLISGAVRILAGAWYSPDQISAALEADIWGVDSQLIRDGSCYVIEEAGEIVATGAWSRRETRFGGDAGPGRDSRLLDPATEPARMRAFFVHPRRIRRGLATAILKQCEADAAAAGFRSAELVATLSGAPFYRARGYTETEPLKTPLPHDGGIEFVQMCKSLVSRPSFVGIINITEDSFSDGGRFLDARVAIEHGERLLAEGADWLDLGAESSNPAGRPVPEEVQIARLTPVLGHFAARGARLSVDTHRPSVMRAALDLGTAMVNDITGLADPDAVRLLATRNVPVVIMFARNENARASTAERSPVGVVEEATAYFERRIAALGAVGIARERIILDPGMGYFLGGNPGPSLSMLKGLRALSILGRPLYVSTSRKSFIGALAGGRPPEERAFGTLASELWALTQGADYIRTHEVQPIKDAWSLWHAVKNA